MPARPEALVLDLNDAKDAREYLRGWAADGAIDENAEDETVLQVAKQLFLYVDPLQPLGGIH